MLAKPLFKLLVSLSEHFILSAMSFSRCYPGKFVGLVEEHDEGRLKEALGCIRKAIADKHVDDFIEQLRWPREQWCREVHNILAECDWAYLSAEAASRLSGFAHSWHGTNIDEDLFNRCRFKEGAHSASQLGVATLWHTAASSSLIKEYDRVEVAATPEARASSPPPLPSDRSGLLRKGRVIPARGFSA